MNTKTLGRVLFAPTFALACLPAWGCSCVYESESERLDKAEIVFVARITSAMERRPAVSGASEGYVEAEYELVEILKGSEEMLPSSLRSGYGGGDCGIAFNVGRNLLALTGESGRISVCSGSVYVASGEGVNDRILESYRAYLQSGEPIDLDQLREEYEELMKEWYCDAESSEDS